MYLPHFISFQKTIHKEMISHSIKLEKITIFTCITWAPYFFSLNSMYTSKFNKCIDTFPIFIIWWYKSIFWTSRNPIPIKHGRHLHIHIFWSNQFTNIRLLLVQNFSTRKKFIIHTNILIVNQFHRHIHYTHNYNTHKYKYTHQLITRKHLLHKHT